MKESPLESLTSHLDRMERETRRRHRKRAGTTAGGQR